jgi:class 3 adenylate cyclase
MEQQVHFCTASDGVRIAYAVLDGGGEPIIYAAGFPTHLEMEWERGSSRVLLDALSDGATLIRYDMRGCGLSDTDVDDFSITTLVKDLEAVVEASGAATFSLLSLGMLGGPIAITYAAANPARVSRLVVCSAFTRGERLASAERRAALIDYTEKFGVPVMDFVESTDPNEQLDRTGRDMVQVASSRAVQAALLRTLYAVDVTPLLSALVMPTTVLHGRADRLVRFAEGRALAAAIPHAQLVSIEGNTGGALTEKNSTIPALRRALGMTAAVRQERHSAMRTILFTDIVGHTEMMQRLGDTKGRDVLREHERITRELLKQHGGAEVKTMGDGFMASFSSVTSAMECAIALQRAFAAHTESMPEPLHVRVGLNAGEPIEEDGDLFGATVILASRIAAKAGGGEILVPEPVRHLLSGKSFVFSDRGEYEMKGFDDAVRLYEVRWQP